MGYSIEGMKQETIEQHFLSKIKEVLHFGNDEIAIRFMEKYFEAKQEKSFNNKCIKAIIKREKNNTANEILKYILLNDDGVGIALGYNSREMIENYFNNKKISYDKRS